jgi:hypothetical protein
MLITENQDLASTSRLLWVTEVLYEQKSLIGELKKNEGNSYRALNLLKGGLRYLMTPRIVII